MDCKESLGLLSDYYEHSLDENSAVEVKTHLTRCTDCAGVYEELKVIVEVSHDLRDEGIIFPDENIVWQRIDRAMH